jgi:hypothetical protein
MTEDASPVPLSFPAVLRHPGLSDRYAHLHKDRLSDAGGSANIKLKTARRHDNEGKRWIRRKENGSFFLFSQMPLVLYIQGSHLGGCTKAKFLGNPHIIPASKKDFTIQAPVIPRTFPEPLPTYLSRNTRVPSSRFPAHTNPISSNAGRFSLSLKGTRRELRKMGGRAEGLVRDVEAEILEWLDGGVVLSPETDGSGGLRFPGVSVRGREDLREVGRNPLQVVWATDDAFVRYVVHCCARYHDVVSFSKYNMSLVLHHLSLLPLCLVLSLYRPD